MTNASKPKLNAFGTFGNDPITGAPIMDKNIAQTTLANHANPNSLQSQYLAGMKETMQPNPFKRPGSY
jgi:hypothetical protein